MPPFSPIRVLVWLLLSGICPVAFLQTADAQITGVAAIDRAQVTPFYSRTVFTPAEGLTETPIDIVQDDDGFLWLATHNGLFRFDGVHATKVNYLPADTLPKTALFAWDIHFDPHRKALWIGTKHGLFRYQPHTGGKAHWQATDILPERDIINNDCRVIFTDHQGEVWASFGVRGLVHIQENEKRAQAFTLPLTEEEKAFGWSGDLANHVMAITQDANDDRVLWLAANRGLLRFDKRTGRLRRFLFYPAREQMRHPANSGLSIYAHPNGAVFIGTWNGGLLQFDPLTGQFSQFLPAGKNWTNSSNRSRVYHLIPVGNRQLWVDCSGGSRLFDVEKEQFITDHAPGLSLAFRDNGGNYWQLHPNLTLYHRSENQLEKRPFPKEVACESVTELPFDSTARQVFVRGICQDGLWAMNVDNFTWKQYQLPGRQRERVRLVGYCSSLGGFLVSDERHRLYRRSEEKGEFQLLPVKIPLSVGNLNLLARPDGHLFITGHEGWLFWLQPGSVQPVGFNQNNVGEPHPGFFSCVSSPCLDHRGRVWMRTCAGFSVFVPEENRFLHFPLKTAKGKQLEDYSTFLLDPQRRMWTCGNGAVGWFDPSRPEAGLQERFGPSEGYFFSEASLDFFSNGKVWIGTSEGLTEFSPERGSYRLFKHIQSGFGSVILRDHNNGLMLGENFFSPFRLDSLEENREIPRPYVTWFKVFEQQRQLTGSPFSPDKITLRPNENFISIGFSALAWYQPSKIRFAYQLEGLNSDWIKAEPGVMSASFTNLDGGNYTLKIKTTNHRGEWLDSLYELKLTVGTPWWQTVWFKILAGLILVGLLYTAYRYRINQLRREQAIRDQISRDLHDDVGGILSSISFYSEAAQNLHQQGRHAESYQLLLKIADNARQTISQMSDVVWSMRSDTNNAGQLAQRLESVGRELLTVNGIQLTVKTDAELERLTLRPDVVRNLYLIGKEALHNAAKYSGATEVILAVQQIGSLLQVRVADNGRGFDPSAVASGGNGLGNMLRRAEAISAGYTLTAEPGQGTAVTIEKAV